MAIRPYQHTKNHHKIRHRRSAGLIAAALATTFASSGLAALPTFADEISTWTFEEVMESRKKYEPEVDAKCNYDFVCELLTFNQYRDDGDLVGYSVGIFNSHPILITSFQPESGALKLFYNDRATTLMERFEGEYGVHAILETASVTLEFKKSGETYTYSNYEQIIPHQEIEFKPEGFEIPEGDYVSKIIIRLKTNGARVLDGLEVANCVENDDYVVGKECSLRITVGKGPNYVPVGEVATEKPTHYPSQGSHPYAPKPEPKPEPEPEVDSGLESKPSHTESPQPESADDSSSNDSTNSKDTFAQNNQTPGSDNSVNRFIGATTLNDQSSSAGNHDSESSYKLPLAPNTGFASNLGSIRLSAAERSSDDSTELSSLGELFANSLPHDPSTRRLISLLSFTISLFVLSAVASVRSFRR